MANRNGKITKDGGISLVADIYIPLGIARPSEGYSLTHVCCNGHGKLRKWARYKPVRSASLKELTDADRAAISYGFTCNPSTSPLDVSVTQYNCEYPRPNNSEERKRISDFVGYNHNVTPPATPMGNAVYSPFSSEVSFSINTNTFLSRDTIAHSDLNFLKDYYPCVAVTGGQTLGTSYRWKTADTPLSDGESDVIVSVSELPNFNNIPINGMRYIHCLASNPKKSMRDSDISGTLFYPLMADEEMTGDIVWDENPIQYSLVGLLGGVNVTVGTKMTFRQAAQYAGLSSTGTNRYLGVSPYISDRGTVIMLIEFTNKTGSAIAMDLAKLRARLSPTLAGAQSWSTTHQGLQPTAYTVASDDGLGLDVTPGAVASSVNVPANDSVRVIIALPGIAATANGSIQNSFTADYIVAQLQILNGSNRFMYDYIRITQGSDRDINTGITT